VSVKVSTMGDCRIQDWTTNLPIAQSKDKLSY